MKHNLEPAAVRIAGMAQAGLSTQAALAEVLAVAQKALDECAELRRQLDETKMAPIALTPGAKPNQQMAELADGVVSSVRGFLSRSLDPIKARLLALESARTMTFEGPHDPSKSYGPGSVVQRASAVWVALASTSQTPGSSADWRRLVQSERERA